MASFVFAPGCGPQKADSTDSAGGATDDTTGDEGASAGETTSSSVTTGATDTTGPGTTDGGDSTPTGMSTEGDPEETAGTSDTTGAPAGCPADDPATSAAFKVSLDAWPDRSDEEHLVDSLCDIDAVDVAGAVVITTLTCDVDGVARGAKFEFAVAPEGAVDWQVGQAVAFHSRAKNSEFSGDTALHVTLADDPSRLLVDGRDVWGVGLPVSEDIGPIHREIVMECTADDLGEEKNNELRYSLMSGAELTVWAGSRGSLAIDASRVFAIDLAQSGSICCHGDEERSLIRRVLSE
ncbi:hypothetical protein [Nannocystis punicea]|uniref:Uncharacterized protein n=1 Tax=Nannocystis punicea TaxID=2995304 RepID=A0ABY7HB52_9BACT|nr:hypothetical protein [Nannocystis poenicansa]WAS96472.1 hypothetical protein O0S08_09960 [Nannocystis poenicansa]